MKTFLGRAILATTLFCSMQVCANAQRTQVAFDDFEGLTMVPFTLDYGNPFYLDGTDYTKAFPAGWVLDNSANLYDNTEMPPEFDGWSLMDVPSWIGHADIQAGRDRCLFGNTTTRNVALVADPDEADDGGNTSLGSPADPLYNSYISRTYDVTGRDMSTLEVSFDYDFVTEDTQTGVVDISFDGGSTFVNILSIDSTVDSGTFSTANGDQGTFVAGVDFTADVAATSVVLRFGCIEASNDWWFCVDNIGIADGAGVIAFEDFEDPAIEASMLAFDAVNSGPTEASDPSDGTDWTRTIPNWSVINDGPADRPTKRMYRESIEEAFQGWAAMDVNSWFDQQGDQQRGFFDFPVGSRNTALIADGDAHQDNMVPLEEGEEGQPEGEDQFNSFVQRTYDMSGFDNTTLEIDFDWDTRLYDSQQFLAEVSFDYGQTWSTILDVDSSRLDLIDDLPEEPDYEAMLFEFLFNDNNSNGFADEDGEDVLNTFAGTQFFAFGDAASSLPAAKSNTVTLRFGCINAGNDWWAAVDNVQLTAEPQAFLMGDANDDGVVNFLDLDGFSNALFGVAPYDARLDFFADGVINFSDLNGFSAELFN
ncbi:hypothetical protein [Mariniblastus fucicola]|uniref:Uncharacterized protein n=1 Tax=Mariniblastus fucicola TaxID=980251 RepID=A0A5B9PBC3_9BACT|nr:hypothetical protein [Mariniblastus fucicola]QEG24027.1 hypothetical protein MFFC18_39380 [Mariniblastus fucicola]